MAATSSLAACPPTAPTCPLMQGSTSPAKKGLPSHSHHPCQATRLRTRPTARHVSPLAGSRPRTRSSLRTCIVESHPWLHAAPPHRPSAPCGAISRAPSVATLARSAATSCAGAAVRSRITCQRIEGSESSSHRMTDLFGFGACRLCKIQTLSEPCRNNAQLPGSSARRSRI